MFKDKAYKLGLIVVCASVAVVGLGIGAAVAVVPSILAPAGVTTKGGVAPSAMPDPSYPTNSSGKTFGSLLDSNSPSNDPDLIKVEATNGKVGYVYKKALDDADGTTAAQSFKSPEDAIAYQRAHASDALVEIPVYSSDGKTQIGTFGG